MVLPTLCPACLPFSPSRFPRVVIVLLWLFSSFFTGVYHGVIIPILGFLFLPLTLIVYTYTQKTYGPHVGTPQLIAIIIALVFDLGLLHGGTRQTRVRS